MYEKEETYKIKTKEGTVFTAIILEEDTYSIKIKSIVDGNIDIIHKDNILKARPAYQDIEERGGKA